MGQLQLAKVLISEGKLDEAASKLEADLSRDLQLRDDRFSVRRRNWLGWIRALQGNRAAAANSARALLRAADSPINIRELRGAGVMLAEIGEVTLAQEVLARLEAFVQSGFEGNVFTGAVSQIRGEIARAQGQKELAGNYSSQTSAQWVDVLTLWSAGRISEDLGDFPSASEAYRQILDRKGELFRSNFPGLRSLALAGSARCELGLGHRERVQNYYDEFFKTLGKYSPNIGVVMAARRDLDRLRSN
jgi:tetratricopeptide (TPR) repeat protein